MFHEVPEDHVSSAPRKPRSSDVFGGELLGHPFVAPLAAIEPLEHLPVPRRLRAPAFDDVTPVWAVTPDRVDELLDGRERSGELVA